jgi:hypothetical protein
MYFEVTVPDPQSQSVHSLQVNARHWRSALAAAVAQVGSPSIDLGHSFVHIDGAAVHVLDRQARRSIQVRRLPEEQVRISRVVKAFTGTHPAVGSGGRPGFNDKATGSFRAIAPVAPAPAPVIAAPVAASPVAAPAGGPPVAAPAPAPPPAAAPPEARVLVQSQAPAAAPNLSKASPWSQPVPAAPAAAPSDDILEDIFLESPALLESAKDLTDACERMLRLATQKMPSEHGAVFLCESPGKPLVCAAAHGAQSRGLSNLELSSLQGLASLTLQTGTSLSLLDPSRHPQYTADFAKLGIAEKSLLMASIQDEASYGVIVLLNRTNAPGYSGNDANALHYIGKQLGDFIQSLIDGQ